MSLDGQPRRGSTRRNPYLIHATLSARSVGEDNLDVDVVVRLIRGLGVSPLVLPREEETNEEEDERTYGVDDSDNRPGHMVAAILDVR